MEKQIEHYMRKIPSVDAVLKELESEKSMQGIPRKVIIESIRQAVSHFRSLILNQKNDFTDEKQICREIIADAKNRIQAIMKPYYRKVINATGIILHTGLGRAVLSEKAIKQIQEELSGYSLLQVDIDTGNRSKRDYKIEQLLQILTGAQAATIVNNNAAATAVVLNTVAKNKEVIVSRGQLVEIGGSFRLPDVMAFSGAKLVEVGTTNKTHLHDYANAITENTAAILRVHPSNYKISGFTSEVSLEELVELANSRGLVLIDDVGAGSLIDFSRFGFEDEPKISESISKGADIVTSSADKLIGASQAGVILGKTEFINAVRKNQFSRIIRPGKLTLAALEATLMLFLDESTALNNIPTLKMLMRSLSEITNMAESVANRINNNISDAAATTIAGYSQMGSGSLPAQNLATTLVAVNSKKIKAESLARLLRGYSPPIFTRIHNNQVLIDPRTLLDGDDNILVEAVSKILGRED